MKKLIGTCLAALAILAFAACSSDGGGTTTDTPAETTPDVPGETTGTVTFKGTLVDFASKAPKADVDMVVLNNETGEPLDLAKWPAFKSGSKGEVVVEGLTPGTQIGFKASGKSGAMEFKDSYQFNYGVEEEGRRIYACNTITYKAALSTAAIKEVDKTTLGHLAGTVYYVDAAGIEDFIGCLTVEVQDENGKKLEEQVDDKGKAIYAAVRYFDTRNDLPTNIKTADMTHLLNSRFMVGNLPSGRYTVVAKKKWDGSEIGRVTLHAFPDSIAIGNIYFKADKNPTPATEECKGVKDEM
jgi:hypothetical protein